MSDKDSNSIERQNSTGSTEPVGVIDKEKEPVLVRRWINQPSKHHEFHKLHGVKVLAWIGEGEFARIWFISGPLVSQYIHKSALSRTTGVWE